MQDRFALGRRVMLHENEAAAWKFLRLVRRTHLSRRRDWAHGRSSAPWALVTKLHFWAEYELDQTAHGRAFELRIAVVIATTSLFPLPTPGMSDKMEDTRAQRVRGGVTSQGKSK
jgi:hypothetical protein